MASSVPQPNAVDEIGANFAHSELQILRNQKTPSGLLPAEDKLLKAAVQGTECLLSVDGKRPEALTPEQAAERIPERLVRGAFIRFLATGGDKTVRVQQLILKSAYVTGKLDLAGARCKVALQLTNCFFAEDLALEFAQIPMLVMDGSRVPGISGDLVRVDTGIYLREGFLAEGRVRFYNAQIGGDLDCNGGVFKSKDDALICSCASIKGNLYLMSGFRALGQVRLSRAEIGSSLDATGGLFVNAGKPALVGETVSAGGDINLTNARIMGSVIFRAHLSPVTSGYRERHSGHRKPLH